MLFYKQLQDRTVIEVGGGGGGSNNNIYFLLMPMPLVVVHWFNGKLWGIGLFVGPVSWKAWKAKLWP